MTTYHVFGHKPDEEARNVDEFRKYVTEGIFGYANGRYLYSKKTDADVIVLAFGGMAQGHFEIAGIDEPTKEALVRDSTKKYAYLVTRSALYPTPYQVEKLRTHLGHAGVPLDEDQFQELLTKVGQPTFADAPNIDTRFCRIAYNKDGWQRPSGVSPEIGTYVASNKFGHEEWNFRFDWLIDGRKYGFVEPVHKFHSKYKGTLLSLKLFTKTSERSLYIGRIKKAYVPHDEELTAALATIKANGWLDEMKKDVERIGGDPTALDVDDPGLIINIRFDPADVELEDEMVTIAPGSVPLSTNHYVLIKDDGSPVPTVKEKPAPTKLSLEQREQLQHRRATEDGTVVNPIHAKLQNRLYEWLCEQHGAAAVGFEIERVDLRVALPGETTFIEIKSNATAKSCIRLAFGQVFEYAMYPGKPKADQLLIVGHAEPTDEDRAYLAYLRNTFDLPIHYAACDKVTGVLAKSV
jgi:hypothetical protein